MESEKREGMPRIAERDDYAVYGWSDIEPDSPTMAGGLVKKRIFYLKNVGKKDSSEWLQRSPVEAVVPNSIEAGVESIDHSYHRKEIITGYSYKIRKDVTEDGKVANFFGVKSESRYVIRLLDRCGRHWLYVGESSSIIDRLRKHEKVDGDFVQPDDVELKFISVEEIRTDMSERELYREVCRDYDISNKRVLGGR